MPTVDPIEAAKRRHEEACTAFEMACAAALQASIRAGGLAVALSKGILRRDDAIALQIDSDLSQSAEAVRTARQARDAAQQALDTAGPPLWQRQRLLVGMHDPALLAKYEAARAKAAAADDEAVKSRWEQALAKLGHEITSFCAPEDVEA